MKTNADKQTVLAAIKAVNENHGYKLEISNDRQLSKNRYQFTIQSESSGISGSRYSASGRKLKSASWHAHGFLFDEIFRLDPNAVIYSLGKEITKDRGNWEDKNVGSYFYPCSFSELSIL